MTREKKIYTISLLILIGFTISILYHYRMIVLGFGYPYNTFLFRPEDRFMDFVNNSRYSFNPYNTANADAIYFPVLYRLIYFFFVFTKEKYSLPIFLIVFIYVLLMVVWFNVKTSSKWLSVANTFIYVFLSYPVLFTIDRANFEVLVFFSLFLFVMLLESRIMWSAFFLALAITFKGFPVVLAILLFSKKRYKELVFAGCFSLGITLVAYQSYPNGMIANIYGHLRNLTMYNDFYATKLQGLMFGNSLLGAIKFVVFWFDAGNVQNYVVPANLMTAYLGFVVVMLIVLIFYMIFVRTRLWQEVALLIFILNLFPPVSGDYKLLHIFIPMFLFFSEKEKEKSDWVYAVLFGLLLISKDYYRLPNLPEVSVSVFLNPLLMLMMVLLILLNGTKKYIFKLDI